MGEEGKKVRSVRRNKINFGSHPPLQIGRRSSIIRHMHPVTNKNPTNLIIVPFPTTIHFTS